MTEEMIELFKELISIDTSSNPDSEEFPSTETQNLFAEILAGKLAELGVEDIQVDKYGYVYASLPANTDEVIPAVGFIAHMDTSPDCSGKGIQPIVHKNYDGGKIELKGVTLSPEEFPSLLSYMGKTLITSDGTTLLGADDKAGVTEIITAVKYIIEHPELKHGKIGICFTPDEEIGRGADHFDPNIFGCDFAYTIDGGVIGELSYENFNAARTKIDIKGKSVHPGDAKGIMINAALVVAEFNSKLPKDEIPSKTEGYEGFFHLTEISGNVETAHLDYIIRDFDKDSFERRKALIREITEEINREYTSDTATLHLYDEYLNMANIIDEKSPAVTKAAKAMEKAGVEVKIKPIRGGTDGARITYMGLPCPNIFTGGHNFHDPYEYVCVESMLAAVKTIVNIAVK